MAVYHIIIYFLLVVNFNFSSAKHCQSNGPRLPDTILPFHYEVKLLPFLEGNFTIEGSVDIHFTVLKETNCIIIHSKEIENHQNATKLSMEDQSFIIKTQSYDVANEFFQLELSQKLKTGKNYTLHLEFTGILSSDLEGFYKTFYIDSKDKKVMVAATQFQPTSARKAFPCLDEPQLKATFEIHLGRRNQMRSLSNMPLKETVAIDDDWSYDIFHNSVPMSTYLLAFVVCDFEFKVARDSNLQTEIRLWSQARFVEDLDFASNVTTKALIFLENFFSLKFPLPKLDCVALPAMGANAMENWGLILYRESGLVHDENEGTLENKIWVSYLVSHELTHQWFGNIVTMTWWSDIWLNEGFATYLGFLVVDQIYSSWGYLDYFVVKNVQSVMLLDALKSAPPVSVPVEDPHKIKEAFGDIAYKKGASLIRMMSHFLGQLTLKRGLTHYLKELKYKSAEEDDLWFYLTKVAHEDGVIPNDLTMKDIMQTWTTQSGFPVINVLNRTDTNITIQQTPFSLIGGDDGRRWFIPISISGTSRVNWMRKNESTLVISTFNSSQNNWILINPSETGYYRVNYDEATWKQLIGQLKSDSSKIEVVSRAQLLDDAFNLARAGILPYEIVLNVTSYLANETDPLPWLAALPNFEFLDKMFRSTSSYGILKKFLLNLIIPKLTSMGYSDSESDSTQQSLLRTKIIEKACKLKREHCVTQDQKDIQQWLEEAEHSKLSYMDPSTLCDAVKNGDENIWMKFWEMYQNSSTSEDLRTDLGKALGCSNQIWILQKYLEACFDPVNGIKRQNAYRVYSIIGQSTLGSLLAWNHMRQNWNLVRDYFGITIFALPRVVKAITSHLNTEQQREELNLFYKKFEDKSLKNMTSSCPSVQHIGGSFGPAAWAVEQALEVTEANVRWMNKNDHRLTTLLSQINLK